LCIRGFARGALGHKCAQVTGENAIPEGPKNGTNADKFDLHVHFIVMKIDKNRKCASCRGGQHGFEKQLFDANSHQGVSVAFRSATATIF